jgi:hypothetical protein
MPRQVIDSDASRWVAMTARLHAPGTVAERTDARADPVPAWSRREARLE